MTRADNITTQASKEEAMDGDWNWTLKLIIGCSVGGFLLVLTVFIVITYLCCRSRQRKKRGYENNLGSRDATIDSGYTTFSLQKPGMPPLPASAQSHPHGGLWTTQAVAPPPQPWAQPPTVSAEVKSRTDKKTSSSVVHQSTNDVHKQSNVAWRDRKSSSQMHSSTESMESATGSSSGSYGSQTELIVRDQKPPESKSKNKERKKNPRKSELLEPDMSVIEEESNVGSKTGHQKVLPLSSEPAAVPQHQVVPIRRQHSDELGHPSAAAAASAASEVGSRRTIYPPSESVNVNAVIEIHPKPPLTRTITNTSEDKRLILEAFSFLDEFEQ